MERRRSRRKAHRVPVCFWPRGEVGSPRRGFTTDVSTGGMHIATSSVCPSKTRLRIEVGREEEAFVVEGVVAYSHRIAPELRKLGLSGMGVRFLTVEELVTELVGTSLEDGADDEGPGADEAFYRLRFDSPEHFLRAVDNDVAHGGLFVPTRDPAPLESSVTIEVVPPLEGLRPVRFGARVVHRIEPTAAGKGLNLLAGMGVQLDDPAAARKALAPVVEALERRSRTSS